MATITTIGRAAVYIHGVRRELALGIASLDEVRADFTAWVELTKNGSAIEKGIALAFTNALADLPAAAVRVYDVIAINDRTGYRERLTYSPVVHAEACTMLARFTPAKDVRIVLEEPGLDRASVLVAIVAR